ncbi:hypothetical protein [Actinoallomurus acanthiterrae]
MSDVRVVVRTLPDADVRLMKQVQPTERELMEQKNVVDDRTVSFSTGSWGDDSRDYHLCVGANPAGRRMERDIRLAQVDLEIDWAGGAEPVRHGTPGLVLARWTTDALLSSRIDPKVGHFTEHGVLRDMVNAGIDAYESGDLERAARDLGRAVKLAWELNNEKNLRRLEHLVDIVDAANGIVRVKKEISPFDLESARLGTHHWSRSPASAGSASAGSGADGDRRVAVGLTCECGRIVPPDTAYCPKCGEKLDAR